MYTISSAENGIRAVTPIYALVTLKYLYISTFYSYYYYYIYYCVYHVTTSIECSGYKFIVCTFIQYLTTSIATHHPPETVYTIYALVTLGYSWAGMPKSVTSANAYTELQGFTRNSESTIGKANWTGYGAEYIVNPSKASNERDTEMTHYIIKEKYNALFGDCYFGWAAGYTTNKSEADKFETKEEARDVLTGYFTEEDLKSVKVVKVKE